MRLFLLYAAVFSAGAMGYTAIEFLWRGYSHWTMAFTGGICLAAVYLIQQCYGHEPLWKRCLAGSIFITLTELVVGTAVNLLLGWAVWDYSDMYLNFRGQICPIYSALWFLLCAPILFVCQSIRRRGERRSQM